MESMEIFLWSINYFGILGREGQEQLRQTLIEREKSACKSRACAVSST